MLFRSTVVGITQVAHIGRYIWYFSNSMLYIDIHKISYDTCFSTVCLIRKQCHYPRQALVHPVSLRHRMYGLSILHLKAKPTESQ